jgi:hypothetical protein
MFQAAAAAAEPVLPAEQESAVQKLLSSVPDSVLTAPAADVKLDTKRLFHEADADNSGALDKVRILEVSCAGPSTIKSRDTANIANSLSDRGTDAS